MMKKVGIIFIFFGILSNLAIAFNRFHHHDFKIINGDMAQGGEFPFMVSLQFVGKGVHFCGGTVVQPRWILTAARCVSDLNPKLIKIQYGSTLLDPKSKQTALVSQVFVHPQWSKKKKQNDIALLKLATAIPFSNSVSAVQLPKYQQKTAGNLHSTALGWGMFSTAVMNSIFLNKVGLQTLIPKDCSMYLKTVIHDTNICAWSPSNGTCIGDSGGPLIVNKQQVGIVSWGPKRCVTPKNPTVFTEVSHYTKFIMDTIARNP